MRTPSVGSQRASPEKWPYRTRAGARDRSTYPPSSPMRNPSRMPFFTQAFTRHPVLAEVSGSAARMLARVQRLLELLEEIEMFVGVMVGSLVEQLLDLSLHARSGRPAARGSRAPFRSSRDWPGWAGTSAAATPAPAVPSAPWQLSPESDSTPRNSLPSAARYLRCISRAPAKSFASARCVSVVISPGISFETTEITPRPPRAIRGMVMESSPQSTAKFGRNLMHHRRHLADVAGGFLHADDVVDFRRAASAWPARRSRRCGLARCRR